MGNTGYTTDGVYSFVYANEQKQVESSTHAPVLRDNPTPAVTCLPPLPPRFAMRYHVKVRRLRSTSASFVCGHQRQDAPS
jgi:hypothetical protein